MLLLLALSAAAQTPELEFFEKNVRPVLVRSCQGCHGAKIEQGGLRLDSRAALLKGGARGPAITPGDPRTSLLVKAIRHDGLDMPLGGKLKPEEIGAIEEWVRKGAAWPDEPAAAPASKSNWALQPVTKPVIPAGGKWGRTPVDAFIHAALEKSKLSPAAPADRATLLRRLSFDLTGLPPRPDEVVAFVSDTSPDAYKKVVDRLLESARFGEHWARHWMDLVRYSESHGSQGDFDLPYAWRYRDYSIRAFNRDVPYNQLIREHLAGDLLPTPRINREEHMNESMLGTAHLRMVEYGYVPVDALDDQFKVVDNQIDVISKAFQGLTVSCARCHDHKFDPITQKDFYALYGVLASSRPGQVVIDTPDHINVNRDELARLRSQLRGELGRLWLDAKPAGEKPSEKSATSNVRRMWNLEHADDYKKWFRGGNGLPDQPSKAGEFYVLPEGDRVINGIYPAGVYSHLLSTKHSAVLQSPRFKIDSDSISIRALGGNMAWARIVVENYALGNGGIFPATNLTDDTLRWIRFDTKYRRGSHAYIEVATAEDRTRMAANMPADGRSHFGIAEVVFHDGDKPPQDEANREEEFRQSVEAWIAGTLTASQAALLDSFVRKDLLPNTKKTVPPSVWALVEKYRALEAEIPVPRRAPGVMPGTAFDQPLFVRGNHMNPGPPVPRRYLEVLGSQPCDSPQSGRLELAEAIGSPTNPLTARVMVNRLWHHLFGRGIVKTVDNFGKNGDKPSHPELLDYLASRFVDEGWSIKAMIRLMVTSSVYQLSSTPSPEALQVDASNVLLQHASRRRLPAESIRDSILAVSGELETKPYGPGVDVYYIGKTDSGGKVGPLDGARRRSVYQRIKRNAQNPFLEVFDAPKPSSTRGQRDATNVPAQSLAMLNDPFVIDQASKWAARIMEDGGTDVRDRVARMLFRALGRPGTAAEISASLDYLGRTEVETLSNHQVWQDFAHSIFNFKDFLYVR